MTLSVDEQQRYARHLSLPAVGQTGQSRLKAARVLCVGAGGLGSSLLHYLAAAGVGHLGIMDGDRVELSNLQRQVLYSVDDVGQNKARVAQRRLSALNPLIHIAAYPKHVDAENILTIVEGYDVVVDATDNFPTRYLVNDACYQLKKPNVFASVFQFEGQCTFFTGTQGPCYRCLFPSPPPSALIPNCAEGGVLGVLPGVMGCIQATEVIKYLCSLGDNLVGRLLRFDALAMRFETFRFTAREDCPLCVAKKEFTALPRYQASCEQASATAAISPLALQQLLEQREDIQFIDVREPHERAICHLGGVLIPLGTLPYAWRDLDPKKRTIVYCKAGLRGAKAAAFLQEQGFVHVENLTGGVLAWQAEIDPSLKSY